MLSEAFPMRMIPTLNGEGMQADQPFSRSKMHMQFVPRPCCMHTCMKRANALLDREAPLKDHSARSYVTPFRCHTPGLPATQTHLRWVRGQHLLPPTLLINPCVAVAHVARAGRHVHHLHLQDKADGTTGITGLSECT